MKPSTTITQARAIAASRLGCIYSLGEYRGARKTWHWNEHLDSGDDRASGPHDSYHQASIARAERRREIVADMMLVRFPYAVQIQPRNGQIIGECANGLELSLGYSVWTAADDRRFPQVLRNVSATEDAVIVCRETRLVFAVPARP